MRYNYLFFRSAKNEPPPRFPAFVFIEFLPVAFRIFIKFKVLVAALFLTTSCVDPPAKKIPAYDLWHKLTPKQISDIACYDGPASQFIAWLGAQETKVIRANSPIITLEEEARRAELLHASILDEYRVVGGKEAVILEGVLASLVEVIREELPDTEHPDYSIFLIDSPRENDINAFTTGGGYIYFTKALYDFTEDDAERAYIIAHEIAHNILGHSADHVRRLDLSTRAFGKKWGKESAIIWEAFMAPLDQNDELLCDLSAAYCVYQTKRYDPEAGMRLYYRLKDLSRNRSFTRIFASHPLDEIRMACLGNYLFSAKMRAETINNR